MSEKSLDMPTHSLIGLDQIVYAKVKTFFDQLQGQRDIDKLHETVIAEVERPLLTVVLEAYGWNQLKAAEALGINRNTLAKKIARYGIIKPKAA